MALGKLKILVETRPGTFGDEIEAQFNPDQITLTKGAHWNEEPLAEKDAPEPQFSHGRGAGFSIDLIFDTHASGADVRTEYTDRVMSLATIVGHGNLHRPPICQLVWGDFGEIFKGYLESVIQKFTLFLEDGTPVRARLSCRFKEWQSAEEQARDLVLESVDVAKTRVVRRGDTLSGIAGEEYHDPARWRPIARANAIDDPRSLVPGSVLIIPALTGDAEGDEA